MFSPCDYHMSVTEFLKRGLRRSHNAINFKGDGPDRLNEIDSWVWAQLLAESIANGRLREKVLKFMVHRPCGGHNVNSACVETNRQGNKKCTKCYSRPFRTTATIIGRTDRAKYKRTDNGDNPKICQNVEGVFTDVEIGNQWIVPYNPYLLLKYDCYTCVDVVTVASCVKCLFKYVTKGADMAKARVSGVTSEIKYYQKTRYESGAEAN